MKNIFITGGNRGIGKGLVEIFSENNNVFFSARDKQKAKSVIESIGNENIDYVIQVNGKKRTVINAQIDIEQDKILNIAKNDNLLDKYLNNKSIKKVIFIKNRLLNILINE